MRDVDDQRRAIFVRELLQRLMSGVSESIENRLSVISRMPFCGVRLADLGELFARAFDLVVAEQMDVAGRRLRAFLEAGMAERVHDDMVVRRAPAP